MENSIYFSNLTPQEKESGFSVEKVQKPHSHVFLGSSEVSAVVKKLGNNQRLIKMRDSSTGLVMYAHQIKLPDPNLKDPWRALIDPANTLEEASKRQPLSDEEISFLP